MKNYRKAQITNTRLTEADVRSMRLRHAQGVASVRDLSAEFGLAAESVRKIIRRETWATVSDEGPGAPAEAWRGPEPTREEILASQQRLLGMLRAEGGQGAPSLEEALKAVPPEPAPVLEKLRSELAVHARLGRELDELAGHGNGADVRLGISAISTKSTDGDSK